MKMTTKSGYEYEIRYLHKIGAENPRWKMQIYDGMFNVWSWYEIPPIAVEFFYRQ